MSDSKETPTMTGLEEDVRSASPDNDNERVREKLKNATIAPATSRPGSGAKDSEDEPRRTRKRSHDESDDEHLEADDGRTSRQRTAHERKRSREHTERTAGEALERVKTPPTHPEEDEVEGIAERVASPTRGGLERKRSLGKLDKEGDADQKKKMSKTEEERRKEEEKGTKVGCLMLL